MFLSSEAVLFFSIFKTWKQKLIATKGGDNQRISKTKNINGGFVLFYKKVFFVS